nr:hypothetical protein [Vibrio cholerae]
MTSVRYFISMNSDSIARGAYGNFGEESPVREQNGIFGFKGN